MLTSFKLILRNLLKNRFYTVLNVGGLGLGVSMALITFLFLQSELSYDKHFPKYERIYRVGSVFEDGTKVDRYALSGIGMGKFLKEEYPEIESFVRFNFRSSRMLFEYEEKRFYLDDIHFTDSTVFDIFHHDFMYGEPKSSLTEPNKIVLSETVSELFFGKENPVGKSLKFYDQNLEITGVFKDLPDNTHFRYAGLVSNNISRPATNAEMISTQLRQVGRYTYILLHEGVDIDQIKSKIDRFTTKYGGSLEVEGDVITPIFEPLVDIHFESDLPYDKPGGNQTYIYAFLLVGILLLLLACINYVNLTTARATTRAKEIGVKKVVGARKSQLARFFLLESSVITFTATIVGLALTELLFNASPINQILGKDLSLNLFSNPGLLLGVILIAIIVSLFAGGYPALYLSGINPINVLKGSFKTSLKGLALRKSLVVFQFTISIGVVLITLLMTRQIDFLRNKDLGFQKENLMVISILSREVRESVPLLRERLLQHDQVLGITSADQVPGIHIDRTEFEVESDEGFQRSPCSYMLVGENYLETMEMEVVEGRGFDLSRPTDSTEALLVNEAFVLQQGWGEPIGKRFVMREDSLGNREYAKVIGVVKNFNTHSLHEPIIPIVMGLNLTRARHLHIRIGGEQVPRTVQFIHKEWDALNPNTPLDFKFLDATFDALYNSDERQSHLFSLLSIICMIVSCLGLLGLASFTIQQRTKEIGVRKVLGASVLQIVNLLFKEIFRIVALSALIATPLTYWAYHTWTQSFAYQLELSVWVILFTAIAAVVIAFLTISYHALRVAYINPVHTLKYE